MCVVVYGVEYVCGVGAGCVCERRGVWEWVWRE